MSNNNLSRRSLLKAGSAVAGMTLMRPTKLFGAAAEDAHFMLQVSIYPGADSSYLFDARPLAMKDAGLIQNYTNKDPLVWEGANGTKSLAYDHMEVLRPLKDYFSVVNGVLMAPGFEGHEQNLNQLMTGNPFGGNWFLPELHQAGTLPLDYVKYGFDIGQVFKNAGGGVNLEGFAAAQIQQAVNSRIAGSENDAVFGAIRKRMAAIGSGGGLFSSGARAMDASIDGARQLEATFPSLDSSGAADTTSLFAKNYKSAVDFFKNKLAGGAWLIYVGNFDTHDQGSAKAQPALFAQLANDIRDLLDHLRNTSFDGTRSMLDVTTVMISAEFSRTMLSLFGQLKPDESGSDHNPLGNSVILAGKGIKGGLIIGASDFESVDAHAAPSGAHLERDADKKRIMGKPFDFASQMPSDAKPETYKPEDYLTSASVVNTVFKAFNIDDSHAHTIPGGGVTAKAKVLTKLLG